MRKSIELAPVACNDTHPIEWTQCWEKVLERHILRSVRSSSPQAPAVKTMAADAFGQGGKLLDTGHNGQTAFDHVLRALSRGLSKASPAAVMQTLQNLVVPQGAPFSEFQGQMRLLVSNVRCVGQVAPEDCTMQLANKTSVYNQYPSLSAQRFAGRNMRSVPFDCVDDLLGALSLNQTTACASSRLNGGGGASATRSRTYAKAFHSQTFGGVMAVDQREADLEDEELELKKSMRSWTAGMSLARIIKSQLSIFVTKTGKTKMQPAGRLVPVVSTVQKTTISPASVLPRT